MRPDARLRLSLTKYCVQSLPGVHVHNRPRIMGGSAFRQRVPLREAKVSLYAPVAKQSNATVSNILLSVLQETRRAKRNLCPTPNSALLKAASPQARKSYLVHIFPSPPTRSWRRKEKDGDTLGARKVNRPVAKRAVPFAVPKGMPGTVGTEPVVADGGRDGGNSGEPARAGE